jgi:hypothetical protein
MPLARIITRSAACGQLLTLDLIARGYTVEVVNPHSVPDNFADLELRVEGDSAKLVARVEAHNGGRSASLDFVHHLRAPADFDPSAPETVEVIYLSEEPVSLDAGPIIEEAPLLAKLPPLGIDAAFAAAPSLSAARPKSDPADPFPVDSFPVDPVPSNPVPVNSARSRLVETAAVARTPVASTNGAGAIVSPRQTGRLNRPSAWQWGAAMATASMLSLALVLALGVGRFGKTLAAVPEADSEQVAVPSVDSNSPADDFENTGTTAEDAVVKASMIDKTVIGKTIIGSTIIGTKINGAIINGATINDKTGRSRQHERLIARDTVTYLDAARRTAPKAQPAKGLAANTVTYLTKPIPKPAQ